MKERWQRIEAKIDALNLRERTLLFAITALILVTLINTVALDPLFSRQKQLSQQVKLDQQQIAAMQASIQAAVRPNADPDAEYLERLKNLRMESARLRGDLQGLQKGLVSPDKMASLLQDILTRDGKLRLVSLKKLPAVPLTGDEGAQGQAKVAQTNGSGGTVHSSTDAGDHGKNDTVYQHTVEIVVQGRYLDLMNYLARLEDMRWQLFWANASLKVDSYPDATLTLRLFTLSLDKTWLNI